MAFCLPPFAAQEFKQRLKSGEINPAKLAEMTSAERNAFFGRFLTPEQAAQTNALFESKIILKNQQRGMIAWAKTVSGIKESAKRELIDRINKLDKVLTPESEKAFLADLAAQRLGVNVTAEEARKIADLAATVNEQKAVRDAGGERFGYGKAKVALVNYVNDLKLAANRLTVADFKKDPLGTTGKAISNVAGQSKSITSSMDDSAIFNQGWKVLWTNPVIWGRNAGRTFIDIARTIGGKNVIDMVNADIVSRPTYEMMKDAKLAVGLSEEAFPSSLPEKVPVFGRVYKASQDAYTAFVQRTRADVFDKMVDIAQKSGVDLDKNELRSIGRMVNSLTGRGDFGKYEGSLVDAANNLLFSPRFLKSQFDVLLQPVTGAGGSNFVRKQAALNLLKVVSGTAAVLTIANAVRPGSVEWDPRSADFGAIKIGNTRFKLGGGMPAVITLASRLATQSTKSSTTGKVRKLNEGKFGSSDAFDVTVDFFANKASPAAAVVRDLLRGRDFDGNKPTVKSSLFNLVTPFPVKTYKELAEDPNSANDVLALLVSAFGINVNTYGPK